MIKKSFKIEKKFYGAEFIKTSIIDFKDIANISYKNWEISIEWEQNHEEIFNEFMNYCLWLQNESI